MLRTYAEGVSSSCSCALHVLIVTAGRVVSGCENDPLEARVDGREPDGRTT